MNFENIILNSYNRIENRNNLSGYFLREFKKAEKDYFYTADDFFSGCIARLNNYKAAVNEKYEIKKESYKKGINNIENDRIFIPPPAGYSFDNKEFNHERYYIERKKVIYEAQIKAYSKFTINDVELRLGLKLPDIIKIEKGLIEAYSQITAALPKPKAVKPPKEVITTLKDAAVSEEAENAIYKILIDAKLIDKGTKYVNSPDNIKGYFINILEEFFAKGYFSSKPSPAEYLSICDNTFKLGAKTSSFINRKKRIGQGCLDIPQFTLNS